MLIGKYTNTLDPKGRVFVPAAFRNDLGVSFILTRGVENKSLCIYPMQEWEKFVAKLQKLPSNTQKGRDIYRSFCSNANYCELDSQGRLLIPQDLREKAELSKEVLFIGMLGWIEVWNSDNAKKHEIDSLSEDEESEGLGWDPFSGN